MSSEGFYEVLGVASTATGDEIKAAHRRLVQIYHPDRFTNLPADVRAEAEQRMKEVNAAFDLITRLGAATTDSAPPTPTYAPPDDTMTSDVAAASFAGDFCALCGHAPVRAVTLRVMVGKVIYGEYRREHLVACRACGCALYREAQNETLLKGWWGLISAAVNLACLAANAWQRLRLGWLAHPRPTPMSSLTPFRVPLDAGRPLGLRAGLWVTTALVTILVAPTLSSIALDRAPRSPSFDPSDAAAAARGRANEIAIPTTEPTRAPTMSPHSSVSGEPSRTGVADTLKTYDPPWSGPKLARDIVSVTFGEWNQAENRATCAALAPSTLGQGEGSRPRHANFYGGWAVAWDKAGSPGTFPNGESCAECGRGAFGVAGTGGENDQASTYRGWKYQLSWTDGSGGAYGHETGDESLAYITVVGQRCLYNVWSYLGRDHLEFLIRHLRFVDGAP